jgi:23S rRNA-/tRNA-specific pseudouridylate synthase
VAGDATYGSAPGRRREALAGLRRPALHAARLAFDHPDDGRRLAFESPLPADIAATLAALRASAADAR